MAKRSGRRSSGDRVLESRHLIGLFVSVVILCAVFFSLGYVMGKSQYGGAVHAAFSPERNVVPVSLPKKEKVRQDLSAPSSGEWDFYANKSNNKMEQATPPLTSAAPALPAHSTDSRARFIIPLDDRKPARQVAQPARFAPPKLPGGTVTLQVAAVSRQGDALAMADALQRKKFRSFVLAPSGDNLYHVQVGPYPDQHSADAAKAALDRAGFKAIVKR